jgi:rubrerythrin
MAAQLTLGEVLREAIQKEVMSRFMYIGLRQSVKDSEAKETFKLIAEQEESHQSMLEDYLSGRIKEGALNYHLVVDDKISDQFGQPDVTPNMELKDVFILAIRKEQTAHNFYANLAEIHPEGKIKKLLEKLSYEELEHKSAVEKIYKDLYLTKSDDML